MENLHYIKTNVNSATGEDYVDVIPVKVLIML